RPGHEEHASRQKLFDRVLHGSPPRCSLSVRRVLPRRPASHVPQRLLFANLIVRYSAFGNIYPPADPSTILDAEILPSILVHPYPPPRARPGCGGELSLHRGARGSTMIERGAATNSTGPDRRKQEASNDEEHRPPRGPENGRDGAARRGAAGQGIR